MGRKLRVFVSSTMKDLANERDAVCRQLEAFNFEPVNAEGWLPDGGKSWPRILEEVRSSDALLLILGERYGWIPRDGPEGDQGLSVTHLEYRAARKEGLPVLPFQKRLEYGTDSQSNDAKLRDAFRAEVRDWAGGLLVASFDLASDLAPMAAHALVGLLTDVLLKEKVRGRAGVADESLRRLHEDKAATEEAASVSIPPGLIRAVLEREAVLFAGSGISLAAGLPSAAAFVEHLASKLTDLDPDYRMSPAGAMFAGVASDVEWAFSREYLLEQAKELLHPPQGFGPTPAHESAVRLFDLIVTTNWDELFETAAESVGTDHHALSADIASELPARGVLHLHGSIGNGESIVLTEPEVLLLDRSRPRMWLAMKELLRTRPFVFVGTSLRDPSISRLLTEAESELQSYYVSPRATQVEVTRLGRWNLECVNSDAQEFFATLEAQVRSGELKGSRDGS